MINKFSYNQPFKLESGVVLPELEIAYHSAGTFDPLKNNVVWVCHALTANSDVFDWWSGIVGKGKLYDPEHYYIICANVLGSCYGTTGPLSVNPTTQQTYFHGFPAITIRDMVNAHELLRTHLGIEHIHTAIGGSLGGQQAMEWAILQPSLIDNLILIATNAQHSPWGIGFNESQRLAIAADSTWKENNAEAGLAGMKAARSMALLSYRHYDAYNQTQSEIDINKTDNFKVSSYQSYQGDKLVNRFNAFSYWSLSKTMDSHNVGRGKGRVEVALSKIESKTLVIGISSDLLFPPAEQKFLAEHISGAEYIEIDSFFGHDGFLIEDQQLTNVIHNFYTVQV
ncbi:homoserine O-acetyltransferase family protein [Solitalea koreensis]|uniref:Homoserine O-acetyltransferase n=1 Tax=Solitalea koreensis TaxID=543615 RepID=A0A521DTF4_9SPHI|nr:homoserine O-acetyltransferase [Solitalea koreensis]SMO74984.1 homoserine O-acetyltransferase [Solitalea koreensis]